MRIRDALTSAKSEFETAQIPDFALEAEVLLRYATGITRANLYASTESELTSEQAERFQTLIQQRISGIPTAYITNQREFYGRNFFVHNSVLIPRPETELLIETALKIKRGKHINSIADIGTGSGIIAVTLALELPQTKIFACDISAAALKTASENCRRHKVEDRVTLAEGDLLEPLPEPVDMIIANLPYVRTEELPAVNTHGFEPTLALDGGEDGLGLIRRLFSELPQKINPHGFVLLEIGQRQADAVIQIAKSALPSAHASALPDLAGIKRVIVISLESA